MDKSKTKIWIPIYIGDLLSDTQGLTDEQLGKYHRILYHQWKMGHIPDEEFWTVSNCTIPKGASSATQEELKSLFSACLAPIKQLLAQDDRGHWFSPRCDEEKSIWLEKKRAYVERASKGGKAREKKRREQLAKQSASSAPEAPLDDRLDGRLASARHHHLVQEQKQLPPHPPSAEPASGGLPPHPAPRGDGANPSEAKAKRPENAPGTAAGMNGMGRAHTELVDAGEKSCRPDNDSSTQSVDGGNSDPRFEAFKSEIFDFWRGQNPDGDPCPWIRADDRALSQYLAGHPAADLEHFKQLLVYRSRSDINPGTPPRKWVRDLEEFSNGELDRYGKLRRPARVL